jgi:methylenetetrahydrofolate dehydrogenase (NADP+) / methenyltetrahydrofolate cyclohydrolase
MTAAIMDGRALAEQIKTQVADKTTALKARGIHPSIAIFLVGNDEASKIYVREKAKACRDVGIEAELFKFPAIGTDILISKIKKVNDDPSVHSILVQLPLPKHVDENKVLESISPEKDVDCLNPLNLGRLVIDSEGVESCTPRGIMRLLGRYGIGLEGKNVVIINRSKLLGKPLALMMLKKNATVSVCHSKTQDLERHTQRADIIVVGVGKPQFLRKDMVKQGAVIVDAGIAKAEGRVVGDADFEGLRGKASFITPVPGGVGPMTVAMVLENTTMLTERQSALK